MDGDVDMKSLRQLLKEHGDVARVRRLAAAFDLAPLIGERTPEDLGLLPAQHVVRPDIEAQDGAR